MASLRIGMVRGSLGLGYALTLCGALSNCHGKRDFGLPAAGAPGVAGATHGGTGGATHAGGVGAIDSSESGAAGEGGTMDAIGGYPDEPAGEGGGGGALPGTGGTNTGGTPTGGTHTGGAATGGTNSAGSTTGGASAGGGSAGGAGSGSLLGTGTFEGAGVSTDRYAEADAYRNGIGYKFIANGWGDNWKSHSMSWNGSSFTVTSLAGTQGSNYSPAGYPSMFCGLYSKKQSDACGLPATISSLKSLKTGWRWKANGNDGQYNAAFDIWLGASGTLQSYLMVWLRDPPGQQPAGSAAVAGATVVGLPGKWNIWKGTVNGLPIVNYVQPEGADLSELEFDVLDVQKDAIQRGYTLTGSSILAVATGFEVWSGPVSNLVSEDFYVDAQPK